MNNYSYSGSEKTDTTMWLFYKQMLWLQPYIDHMPQISTDDLENLDLDTNEVYKSVHDEKLKKRKLDDNIDKSQEIIHSNTESIKSFEDKLSNLSTFPNEEMINNFMRLIRKSFEEVPGKSKRKCSLEIIKYVPEFIERKNK